MGTSNWGLNYAKIYKDKIDFIEWQIHNYAEAVTIYPLHSYSLAFKLFPIEEQIEPIKELLLKKYNVEIKPYPYTDVQYIEAKMKWKTYILSIPFIFYKNLMKTSYY